jgi:biotin transport system substrate-specific component|tara:strand:+ start:144 stop:683 length:540 start_codon:yes stop_codon:yes gene_type:complete
MLRSNHTTNSPKKHSLLAGAFLVLVIVGAKIDLDLGGLVSFTLQTLFLGLAYYYLPTLWSLFLVLSYLALGAVGIPVFNGGVGWNYFVSWPLGFFIGFVLAAAVPSPSSNGLMPALSFFLKIHVVIAIAGIVGVACYGGSYSSALETAIDILPGAVIKSAAAALIVFGMDRWYKRKDTL